MGVNIYLVEVEGRPDEDVVTGKPEWWDSSRLAGDNDLYHDESLEWDYADSEIDAVGTVKRPANWQQFREWVSNNVPEPNRRRLLVAAQAMEKTPRLFFQFVA